MIFMKLLVSKRQLLSDFLESVHVDRDGKKLFGTITYYYPPPDLNEKAPSGEGAGLGVPLNRRSRRDSFRKQPLPYPFSILTI